MIYIIIVIIMKLILNMTVVEKAIGHKIILALILLLAISVRLFGINWDQGYHLHPDERAIIMYSVGLNFPSSIEEFLSPASPWNPHFFAYGSFPLYLLKIGGNLGSLFDPELSGYGGIQGVGRLFSALADMGSLVMVYMLGRKLFNTKIGLFGSFLYAISVLPIQLSHFYAVDTILTFFILLTLYQLLRFYEKPTIQRSLLVGVFFGLALATKTSALLLLVSIGFTLVVDFALIVFMNPHRPHVWILHIPRFFLNLIRDALIIAFATVGTFLFFEPYSLIDFKNFLQQTLQQSQMTKSAFTFPYTLQYVGKIPYVYELKNVFFWGLGPVLATFSFMGVIYGTLLALKKEKTAQWAKETIIITFFWAYFLVVGKFAIGFMRYLLPLYPIFALFTGVFVYRLSIYLKTHIKNNFIRNTLYVILYTSILVWPVAFMQIYNNPPTRVSASDWINTYIPKGSTLAIEHWDDSLPLYGQENFNMITFELYNHDNLQKWEIVNQQLEETDYIILASNRLYVPLQKLIDCKKLPQQYCYSLTAEYYRKLFSGELGFRKAADFIVYPSLQVGGWKLEIRDDEADESFTVYDHPKVLIFKKQ